MRACSPIENTHTHTPSGQDEARRHEAGGPVHAACGAGQERGLSSYLSHQGYPGSVHDRHRFSAHSSSSDIGRTAGEGDAEEGGETRPVSPESAMAASPFAFAW